MRHTPVMDDPQPEEPPVNSAQDETDEQRLLRELSNSLDPILECPEPPALLYHYTTLTGFEGILASRSLWATDIRYLNDASELIYALQVIYDVLEGWHSTSAAEHFDASYYHADRWLRPLDLGIFQYVTCFCEKGDLLSQWRGYSAGAPAVSIGFDLRPGWQTPDFPYSMEPARLVPMVYDPGEQRTRTERVIEAWEKTILSLYPDFPKGYPDPFDATIALNEALEKLAATFKHPSFEEEREWRLIVGEPPPRAAIHFRGGWGFRQSPLGFIPYRCITAGPDRRKELDGMKYDDEHPLPIRRLIQGPMANPDLALSSLELLIRSYDYYPRNIKLANSRIPLRT